MNCRTWISRAVSWRSGRRGGGQWPDDGGRRSGGGRELSDELAGIGLKRDQPAQTAPAGSRRGFPVTTVQAEEVHGRPRSLKAVGEAARIPFAHINFEEHDRGRRLFAERKECLSAHHAADQSDLGLWFENQRQTLSQET